MAWGAFLVRPVRMPVPRGAAGRFAGALAVTGGGMAMPMIALAQEQVSSNGGDRAAPAALSVERRPESEASADDAPVDEVIVTGQRVRGTAIDTVAPVAVLSADQIKALGVTSLAEMLKRLKPLTTSSSGGDPVFLLNGRRVSGFSELQTIPPEAIERTEILSEQDVARFGFPPTVRVVNFITVKRFRATTIQQLAGTSTEGGGATNYTEAALARIDGARRITLSTSYFRQNRVLQAQRDIVPDPDIPFAVTGNVGGIGGASLDPRLDLLAGRRVERAAVPIDRAARGRLAGYADGTTAVTDLGPYRTLVPRTDTLRVDGTIAAPIGKTSSGSLNLSMEAQRMGALNGLAPALLRVPGDNGALPFADDVFLYRYVPDAVLRQRTTNLTLHAAGTVQGSYRRWSWNATGSYDRVRGRTTADLGVPLDDVQAAINGGGDPLMPIDPGDRSSWPRNRSLTTTGTLVGKAVANGPALSLPAGDAQVTVSVDYARSTSEGVQPGAADSAINLARTTRSASVNVDVPLVSPDKGALPFLGRVSANGTLGVTGVSDYGRLANSTVALNWAPTRPVQLTASVTETRTPPAIALLTNPLLVSPNVPFFDFVSGGTVTLTTLSGGNPDLAPERRRVTTLGIAVKPVKDKELRVNLDYLDTRITNQTGYLGSATADFQSAFPGLFQRDPAGVLVQADLRPVNLLRENERKLRLTMNLWTELGPKPPAPPVPAPGAAAKDTPPPSPPKPRPSLFAFANVTWRLDDRLMLQPGSPTLDLLDGATLDGTGGRPRWEVEGNLGGTWGPANLGVYARFQGPTRIRSPLAESDLRFSGRSWLVLYGQLTAEKLTSEAWAKKMSVQFTVENLLNDRIDVRDRIGATPNRFQGAYLDPIGRSVRLGLRKLF